MSVTATAEFSAVIVNPALRSLQSVTFHIFINFILLQLLASLVLMHATNAFTQLIFRVIFKEFKIISRIK